MNISAFIFLFICFISATVSGQIKSAEKIYKRTNDAVVRIYTYHDDNTMHGQGSGVIIKKKGWIITNYHILGDATVLYAEHKGKFIKLDSILVLDAMKDIMILQLAQPTNSDEYKSIPKIRIGNSDNLRVGQKIYAIGSPYGFENTITEGIISGLRTSFDSAQNLIQISAPISPGSSGGAVINSKGELIGISTMIIAGQTAQNLNFAILINDVLNAALNIKKVTDVSKEQFVNYYYQKGYIEYLSKNYLSAIVNYKKAILLCDSQESGILFYYTGLAFHKLNALDSAITYYSKSLEKIEIADTYTGLGTAYYEKNEIDKAILYYDKAIEIVPSFYEAYLGLGMVYYTQRDYVKSLLNLKKTIGLNAKNSKAYYLLGHITYATAQFDDAIYFYQEAIKIDPGYAEAYLAIANTYLIKGVTEKAIEYQHKAYQLKPELRNKKN